MTKSDLADAYYTIITTPLRSNSNPYVAIRTKVWSGIHNAVWHIVSWELKSQVYEAVMDVLYQ